jgi:phosphatidylglycerophosphatase A
MVWPAGLCPRGPGTCGALVATLLAPWAFMPLPWWGRVLALAGLFVLGAWAAGRAEVLLGRKDPGQVVVDEVLGQWLTFLPFAALTPLGYLTGLALFRAFDIIKPFPVRRSETWLPGGWGVMLDDAVAGALSMAALAGLKILWAPL